MKNKGFIKLYRNVLTKPEMTDLVAEQGAAGLGVYIMVLLYLSQCDDFEGAFTNGQLSAFAAQARKPRSYVRQIICGYHLFEINGKRFKVATKSPLNLSEIAAKSSHSPARNNRYAGEDIEIDIEKEKQKKCVCLDDTHADFSDSPQPLRPQSEFETIRDGRRYASHGQPLPDDAPPQRHRNWFYSHTKHDWVPAEEFSHLSPLTSHL